MAVASPWSEVRRAAGVPLAGFEPPYPGVLRPQAPCPMPGRAPAPAPDHGSPRRLLCSGPGTLPMEPGVVRAGAGSHFLAEGAASSADAPAHDAPGVDQIEPLLLEGQGEGAVADEDAYLDVPRLSPIGEVRGGDEGQLVIDDDALGVQAREGPGVRRAWIEVDLREGSTEGPVQLPEERADGVGVGHRSLVASARQGRQAGLPPCAAEP